ncbi:MAG: ATP synthase subunit I [Oscillospiraceae bacterium]|nr:ATP synthase subunit I [Oscillospiraceae bacterium]
MRIKLFSEMINNELSFLLPRTLILDCIVFAATLPVYGLGSEVPLGLLWGTLAMLTNFVILGMSSEKAVDRGAGAKRYMRKWYVLRMGIMAAFIYVSIVISEINFLAAVLPLFYPKAAYTLNAVYQNRKKDK